MCIIIAIPKGKVVSESILKKCWDKNPDGGGFMYAENKKLILKKGYFTFDSFMEDYRNINIENLPSVVHFRIKTHGKIDTENCHPFYIHENLGVAHNGILLGYGDLEHSDTYIFVEEVLKKMPKNIMKYDGIIKLLSEGIGFSKLAFLDNNGSITIINSDYGQNIGGIWYSNKIFISNKRRSPFLRSRYFYFCTNCGVKLFYETEKKDGLCYKCKYSY